MTINSLNKKAEELFNQYNTENMFYAIEDGNFWFSKDKGLAQQYSAKMQQHLYTFKREEILNKNIIEDVEFEPVVKEEVVKESKEIKPKKSSKKSKNN